MCGYWGTVGQRRNHIFGGLTLSCVDFQPYKGLVPLTPTFFKNQLCMFQVSSLFIFIFEWICVCVCVCVRDGPGTSIRQAFWPRHYFAFAKSLACSVAAGSAVRVILHLLSVHILSSPHPPPVPCLFAGRLSGSHTLAGSEAASWETHTRSVPLIQPADI